jgi:hypothetical protein
MAIENNIELTICLGSTSILYEFSQNDGEPKPYSDNLEEKTIRIELQVARTFHKILGLLKTEKDLFQKEDYELLGEMLRKILFGKILGETVLEDNIRNQLENAKGKAKCRIYLEFEKNSDLAILPWEYTIIKDNVGNSIYLAANKDKSFDVIRRIGGKGNLHIQATKLCCVLVVSSIRNTQEDIPAIGDSEVKAVKDLFSDLKAKFPERFDFQVIENPDFDKLPGLLNAALKKFETSDQKFPPYVFHYLGHSDFDKSGGKIAFPNEQGISAWVSDKEFASFLHAENLDFDAPKMVVLQSCDSAKLSNYDGGSGVALCLAGQKIPAVLGMQNKVDVETSTEFMKKFYTALLMGSDVGEAATIGRTFLGKGEQDTDGEYLRKPADRYKTNSFGSPVLFITTKRPIYFLEKHKEVVEAVTELKVFKSCDSCPVINEVPVSQAHCTSGIKVPGRGIQRCNGILTEVAIERGTDKGAVAQNVQTGGVILTAAPTTIV